jgi:hypothetical protein
VRLARAPEAVATAFREGRITLLAAEAILRGAPLDETVTLRRLQEQVHPEIDFWAPPAVARLFLAMVARMGLEGLLDHAIGTWLAMAQPGHEVFERDRWWCTAPACSARKNLHRHHIVYRSHRGPDEPWNLTTLCAWHHQRGVHGRGLNVWGRAPDALVFELGVGHFHSGDRKVAIFAPARLRWRGLGPVGDGVRGEPSPAPIDTSSAAAQRAAGERSRTNWRARLCSSELDPQSDDLRE